MGSNLYIAASGAEARLRQLELVANNLANANSTGYKADRAIFRAAFETALGLQDGNSTQRAGGGVYVKVDDTGVNHAPGPIMRTGAPLDVAIDGEGFFVVGTDTGNRYTRAGSFLIDAAGQLVTPTGQPVLGDSGPIEISKGGARILGSGKVVNDDGVGIGNLRVVDIPNVSALSKQGDGLFALPPGVQPNEIEDPTLIEGSLEGSNVKPVVEMATMVILQRAFEASMQAMQREDQATERLIQEISR